PTDENHGYAAALCGNAQTFWLSIPTEPRSLGLQRLTRGLSARDRLTGKAQPFRTVGRRSRKHKTIREMPRNTNLFEPRVLCKIFPLFRFETSQDRKCAILAYQAIM